MALVVEGIRPFCDIDALMMSTNSLVLAWVQATSASGMIIVSWTMSRDLGFQEVMPEFLFPI
jgi:hypothetical protein